ncbi:MAG: KGK domain-containing protein [Cyanobacteriota bacterium]|nr:KGK domain-containing protein [Cyanobacteriota bacterium]
MSDNFQLLKNDDDVLLFDKNKFKHTFIVGRFKELYLEKLKDRIYSRKGNNRDRVLVIFSLLNGGFRVEQKVDIGLNSSKWESVTEEIECQLLRLGDSGWQKGRLRFKNYVDFLPEDNREFNYNSQFSNPKSEIKIELEFCPDLTIEPESPLDDIRC